MKVFTIIFICFVTFALLEVDAENDCSNVPKVDIHACCKFPKMMEPTVLAEVREKMGKFDPATMNGVLYVCKLKQMIFEKLNLIKDGELAEQAAIDYIHNHLKDSPDWKDVMSKGMTECHKGVQPHIDGIQGTTNFTKEECNMKYNIMTHCFDIYGFTHCPASAHSGAAECNQAQEFVKDCQNHLPAMMEFSANIRSFKKKTAK